MVDAAISSAVVPLSRVALAEDPLEFVFKVTTPVSAFAESRVMTPSLAAVVNDEVPAIVKTPPTLPKISLSAVVPLLATTRAPAVTWSRVMSAVPEFVLSAPALMVAVKVPVPVLIVVPLPLLFMVIAAAPESRCASTTPLAAVSLAVNVRSPLSVVIFALMRMDLPACIVRSPPSPLPLAAVIAAFTVISLLACRVTFEPPDKMFSIELGQMVMSSEEVALLIWLAVVLLSKSAPSPTS